MIGLPILAKQKLMVGIKGFSLMEVSLATGMILGSIISSRLKIRRVGGMIFAATMVTGLLFYTVGMLGSLFLVMIVLAVVGGFITLINIMIFATVQKEVPPEQLGTVFGFLNFIIVGLDPVTFFLSGIGFEVLSVELVFLFSGALVFLTGFFGIFHRPIQNLTA